MCVGKREREREREIKSVCLHLKGRERERQRIFFIEQKGEMFDAKFDKN